MTYMPSIDDFNANGNASSSSSNGRHDRRSYFVNGCTMSFRFRLEKSRPGVFTEIVAR
jgi:hypothetical protein